MRTDNLHIPNFSSIDNLIPLLCEMANWSRRENKIYFTKNEVAEIGIRTGRFVYKSKSGEDAIYELYHTEDREENNGALQNAKFSMNILRWLGLISTDYDTEIYSITSFGFCMVDKYYEDEDDNDNRLLLELFMNINSTNENIEKKTCDSIKFQNNIGYSICYALHELNYCMTKEEMEALFRFQTKEIKIFINIAKECRKNGLPLPASCILKTQKGEAQAKPSNYTRTTNQILRKCDIIQYGMKMKNIYNDENNLQNCYVCTKNGEKYVDSIFKNWDKYKFISSQEFRTYSFTKRKELVIVGHKAVLEKGGILVPTNDKEEKKHKNKIFSPLHNIPEFEYNFYSGQEPKPVPELERFVNKNEKISTDEKIFKKLSKYTGNIGQLSRNISTDLCNDILSHRKDIENYIQELLEYHKTTTKTDFYPFVMKLFEIIGFQVKVNMGRYDGIAYNSELSIPIEIKSYKEVKYYNVKSIQQAAENRIRMSASNNSEYQTANDNCSIVVGYSAPQQGNQIDVLIEAFYNAFEIKIAVIDLECLMRYAIDVVINNTYYDLNELADMRGVLKYEEYTK